MDKPIYLPRTGLVITERCNLACKLCAEYSPYYGNPPHASLDEIKHAIDVYFQCVDSVGDFSVFGGEPFLHTGIYDVVKYLCNFLDQIGRLLILTNGTIVPSKEKLLKLRDENIGLADKLQISISDYGSDLSKRAADVEKSCNDLNIKCRVIKYHGDDLFCDGWVDYGDHTKKYYTEEEIREHAQKCNFRKNIYSNINFFRGQIYFMRCGRAFWRKILGVIPENSSDVIKFPHDIKSDIILELKDKIRIMLNSEYSDSCAYCNGMCDDSLRFKPAEQLKSEELRKIKKKFMEENYNG